jgi:hypothetical protein
VNAIKGSGIRIFLDSILSCGIPRYLLALVEKLDQRISRFTFLHRKRASFGSVQQVRHVVMGTCDLIAIFDPGIQASNCHFTRPLMPDNQKRPPAERTSARLHHLHRPSISEAVAFAAFWDVTLRSEARPSSVIT